jgi:hypothetical protein
VLLIIAAGLGSVDWVQMLRKQAGWRSWALPVVCAGWVLLSLGLACGNDLMRDNWMRGTGEAQLAAELDADPEFCGLALYGMQDPFVLGRGLLAVGRPVYSFHPFDPAGSGRLPVLLKEQQPAFNRIIGALSVASELPANFTMRSCALTSHETTACVFTRRGACDGAKTSPFGINDVLVRLDY